MAFLRENIFQKIIDKKLPADVVFESEKILAFRDIAPKAATHILIVPKKFFRTAREISEKNLEIFGELFLAAKKISEKLKIPDYKLAMNVGENAGQVVPHVHLHFLSPDFQSNL